MALRNPASLSRALNAPQCSAKASMHKCKHGCAHCHAARRVKPAQAVGGSRTTAVVAAASSKPAVRSPFLNGPPEPLPYLSPDLPGYKNWDPLRLAEPVGDKEDPIMNVEWLSYAELIHGRWAMLAAAGIVAPEFLGRWGVIPTETALPWFVAGGLFPDKTGGIPIPFANVTDFTYWANPAILCWTMFCAMGFAEGKRMMDYKNPGSQSKQYFLGIEKVLGGSGDAKYPGGPFFNFFNLGSKSAEEMATLKTKEINNGRLAMVAMAGFGMQANVTRVGPVQNLYDVFFSDQVTQTLVDGDNFGLLVTYLFAIVGTGATVVWALRKEETMATEYRAEQAAIAAEEAKRAAEKAAAEAQAAKEAEANEVEEKANEVEEKAA